MASRLRLAALGVCLFASTLLGSDLTVGDLTVGDLTGGDLTGGDFLGSGLDARDSVGMGAVELIDPNVASPQLGMPIIPSRGRVGAPPRTGGLFSLRAPRLIRPQGFSVHQGELQASGDPSAKESQGISAFLPKSPSATWN
ncbi:MAG: hypothetical protein P8L85_16000 [Rubripirellula sp.]|nr:hypothetical protein [Rubripirellula sp.]